MPCRWCAHVYETKHVHANAQKMTRKGTNYARTQAHTQKFINTHARTHTPATAQATRPTARMHTRTYTRSLLYPIRRDFTLHVPVFHRVPDHRVRPNIVSCCCAPPRAIKRLSRDRVARRHVSRTSIGRFVVFHPHLVQGPVQRLPWPQVRVKGLPKYKYKYKYKRYL